MFYITDKVGKQYGKLTVVSIANRQSWRNKNRHYVCKCECGVTKIINSSDLASGNVNSCGCLKKEKLRKISSTHGNSNHPLYGIWSGMIHRCTNKNIPNYKNYGGRGIYVCERWLKFDNFVSDMGNRPSQPHSIDRINNDDGYHPKNCRWSLPREQQLNKRNSNKKRNLYFSSNNIQLSIFD